MSIGLYFKTGSITFKVCDVILTLIEVEFDIETEKYVACMKLYRSVHTDRDPLTIEFQGVGIGL